MSHKFIKTINDSIWISCEWIFTWNISVNKVVSLKLLLPSHTLHRSRDFWVIDQNNTSVVSYKLRVYKYDFSISYSTAYSIQLDFIETQLVISFDFYPNITISASPELFTQIAWPLNCNVGSNKLLEIFWCFFIQVSIPCQD